MTRGLLDTNVLIALLDETHQHHEMAKKWFKESVRHGWASCPLTQNGFIRIISHPRYVRPIPIVQAIDLLGAATSMAHHVFWPDDLSLLSREHADPTHMHNPRDITDVYLLALAVKNGGRLVTFDRTIPMSAVRGASSRHLVVL